MSHNVPSLKMCNFSCHCATQCPIFTSLTTMSHATKRGRPMGHRRHTSLQPVRWRQTQSPPSSPNRQPPFTLRSRSEFTFVVPPLGGRLSLGPPSVICITPMSGFVRFCPVFSMLSRLSTSTPCTHGTYSNFHPAPDRTYQTSVPQQHLFFSALTDLRPLTSDFSAIRFPLFPGRNRPPAGGIENKFGMGILKSISWENGRAPPSVGSLKSRRQM